MDLNKKEKIERFLRYGLFLMILICFVLLLPQARNSIIKIGEKILGRGLNHDIWMKKLIQYSLFALCFIIVFLLFSFRKKLIHALEILLIKIKTNKKLIVGICFAFIFVYIYLCFCIFRKTPLNSDLATMVLLANDIFHGNIFLSDWGLAGISFLTTDLPFYVIGVMGYGIHINAYYIAVTLMFVIFSLSSFLLFKWRNIKNNAINLLIWLSVGALPIGLSPNVLRIHTAIWIYVFAACFFIEKMYYEDNPTGQSKKYLYPIFVAVCFMLGTIGDATILVGLTMPVFIVCFYLWLTDCDKSKFIIKLAVSIIIGTLSGLLIDKLYFSIGGADKNSYLLGIKFKDLNNIPDSFLLYIKGLLGLFDADFTGKGVFQLNTLLYGLRLLIVVFGIYIILKTIVEFFKGKSKDIVSVILSIGFVSLSVFYIFTVLSVNISTTRYYAYTPILFSILISRFLFEREIWSSTIFPRKIRVVYGIITICVLFLMGIISVSPKQKWTKAAADNPYIELGDALKINGLEKGYSGFWDASVTTVTTKNNVKIRPVLSYGESVMPYKWFSKKNWYNEYANFIVISDGFHGIDEKNTIAIFGNPQKRLSVANFIIFIYDRDISNELTVLRE